MSDQDTREVVEEDKEEVVAESFLGEEKYQPDVAAVAEALGIEEEAEAAYENEGGNTAIADVSPEDMQEIYEQGEEAEEASDEDAYEEVVTEVVEEAVAEAVEEVYGQSEEEIREVVEEVVTDTVKSLELGDPMITPIELDTEVKEPRGMRANDVIVDEVPEPLTEDEQRAVEQNFGLAEVAEVKEEPEVITEDSPDIQSDLNALKESLTQEYVRELEIEEPISKVHALHEEFGRAGSRNAFPIEQDRDPNERKGQRPGMFIGHPTRHSRKHLVKSEKPKEQLGEGAFKIDENRPINN